MLYAKYVNCMLIGIYDLHVHVFQCSFSLFLGMGAGPLQLGKITRGMPKLGKSCGVKFFK